MAQVVKNLLATWKTGVQSLGGEDSLEKEMATHSSTRAWKTPWVEEPSRLQSIESQRVGCDGDTSLSLSKVQASESNEHSRWPHRTGFPVV